ncbi:type I restriction enzyme R subunit [Bradyrhizobium japonicum]|uniref:type I restriction endonuclease subunit R n=1 Tax=Bradyrhizobium japonicum TaxID=375 RepID=UPI002168F6FA|nr:type I restriction endonuclease subunit R [Bradyrhizobium japonicum]MCS3498663.1 type I restriction enzyme R subunit [Bradyrhizobium japonicum]MCS3959175.1 type I restriction enzyme R subunit [Bradyrhizobium japonicum]MCS4000930.1 type I restriction enzyme R subunit [Bradyrhizobium japonicum]
MSGISEDDVEQAMLQWLSGLGWSSAHGPTISPPDANTPGTERDSYRDVILRHRLAGAIARLNPHIPAGARDDALRRVLNPNVPGLVNANRQVHRWLVDGVPVEFQKDGETRGDRVRLVDFTDVASNDWLAVNQFSVQGPKLTRRPDVVLFVNGLPLVVVELKNPGDEDADIWAAWNQLQAYQEDIPDLFNANALQVISDGIQARMGSLTSDRERFMAWPTIDGVATDPLGAMRELETLVLGLCQRGLLLEYLRHFVLFEDDGRLVKKVAGYHQFHAVRAVVQSVLKASAPGGTRKGGVVWHTQGAGKSIEMTCLAGALMAHPDMGNPTLVVVTDRNDLDNQLFGVFAAASEMLRETPTQADTRPELRRLLANRPSGGIIFTTIQKFTPGEDEDTFPVLSDRRNIVVICDEAHRSQYGFEARLSGEPGSNGATKAAGEGKGTTAPATTGSKAVRYGYAQNLRDALPGATFVAFTGTPVSLDDRDTRAVFGDYVHIYDIEQAVKDGATVPIYYESRLARLELKEADVTQLDSEIDELTEDEEGDAAKVAKLRRWAALEQLVGAPPRIQKVAADIVAHFESRLSAMAGKAMVVAMSRDICAHLYNAVVALRPEWHSDDPMQGVIKVVMTGSASDKALLKPHIYPKDVRKRLETRFKNPADPFKLVIVRDMWLTGFDAPCLHTMYVDKPMRGHNLMQAIARVNRVFKDKPGGLVVDYIGIANELKAALADYTQAHGRGRPTIDAHDALAVLREQMDVLQGMLHGLDYGEFRSKAWQLLPAVANHVLGLDDGKKRFADAVLAASKAFALCCTLDAALAYRDELAFLQAVKAALTKHGGTDKKLTDEQKEHALRQIISRAVVSDEVVDIFTAAGLKRPDIGVLSDEFLEDVRHMKERNLAVELLERLLKGEIKSRFKTNVVQSAKFSDLLQQSLTRYRNRAVETAQIIEELIAMAKRFQEAARRGEDLGLNADELAFYDALATNEAAVRALGDDTLKKIAVELTLSLRKSVTVDWAKRETVRAKIRVMVKTLLRRYKYPPDKQEEATETVLKQAEALSEAWAA